MKLLEDKIREEGILLKGNVLKVDSFLNHQMDVELLDEMGKEFYQHFKDKKTEAQRDGPRLLSSKKWLSQGSLFCLFVF